MLIDKIKQGSLLDLIAIFTPCIILIGASYKLGFYYSKNIDAVWMISLFSPVDFMVSNVIVYFYYVLAIIYLDKIIDGKDNLKAGLISANVMLISSLLAMVFLTKTGWLFALNGTIALNSFASILYSTNIGYRLFGILVILVGIPYFNGQYEASNLKLKELPLAILEHENQVLDSWILLDKYSDKAILMKKLEKNTEFKIIELKDIKKISQEKLK